MSAPTDTPPHAGWTEVLVAAPLGWEELVADVLGSASGTTVAFGAVNRVQADPPAGTTWVRTALPPGGGGAGDAERRRAVGDALARLAETTGEPELAGLAPRFRAIPPEDWADAWKKTWKPFRVGRLAVVAPHRRGELRSDDVALELVPGGAFGTGRHATTRACLQLVQELVEPGARVLDAGTGTGILAVAAALFGAGSALGFDLDPSAEPAARDLARRNGVADRCAFRTGGFEILGPDDGEDTGFDGALANLYSDLVQRHAAELARRVRPGGWLVFSGCPEAHLAPTRAALEAAELVDLELRRRGRWCTVSARRPVIEGGRSVPGVGGV